MRLIDADKLKENLTGVEIAQYLEDGITSDTYDGSTVMDIIDNQPTAYDVDDVLKQIKDLPHGATLNVELEDTIVNIVEGVVKDE